VSVSAFVTYSLKSQLECLFSLLCEFLLISRLQYTLNVLRCEGNFHLCATSHHGCQFSPHMTALWIHADAPQFRFYFQHVEFTRRLCCCIFSVFRQLCIEFDSLVLAEVVRFPNFLTMAVFDSDTEVKATLWIFRLIFVTPRPFYTETTYGLFRLCRRYTHMVEAF
jgi:hypothetical protein